MTQPLASDFPIDPTTTSGTALADILNRFAESVGTNNSGATAPPDTTPGMFWLDTSASPNGVLKMRNAANTGWIVISTPGGAAGLADGTVAAPGLAFTSEPGLGMYRAAAGLIGWAEAGAAGIRMDMSVPASTGLSINPRSANGAALLTLINQPALGAPDYNLLQISAAADGSSSFIAAAGGAAAKKSMKFGGASGYTFDAPVVALNYNVTGAATTVWYQSAGVVIQQYNTSWFWQYTVATGALAWVHSSGNQTIFNPDGSIAVNGRVSSNGPAMRYDGNVGNWLHMQSGSNAPWSWLWNNTNALLQWLGGSSEQLIAFDSGGSAFKASGAGSWLASSDARLKNIHGDYTMGLAEVLQIKPRWVAYKDTPDRQFVSPIAQEIRLALPDTITVGHVKRGDIELEDGLTFDPTNIQYALVNAVKTLNAKLDAMSARIDAL